MKFLAHVRLGVLCPDDEAGKKSMAKLKEHSTVSVEVKRVRNPRRLRLYWALVNKIWEQRQDQFATPEALHEVIKYAVGLSQVIEWHGKSVVVPGSISFDRMSETEFSAFFDSVVRLIVTKIIPGMDEGELRREIEEMIGARIAA